MENPTDEQKIENTQIFVFVTEELFNIVEDAVPEWPRHKQYAAAKDILAMLREMLLKNDAVRKSKSRNELAH